MECRFYPLLTAPLWGTFLGLVRVRILPKAVIASFVWSCIIAAKPFLFYLSHHLMSHKLVRMFWPCSISLAQSVSRRISDALPACPQGINPLLAREADLTLIAQNFGLCSLIRNL